MSYPWDAPNHLYRSEDMTYVSLTITNDAAHDTIHEIGKFGRFSFVDLAGASKDASPSRQHLLYKKRLADCLYWEKKFISFREEMKRRGVVLPTDDTAKQEIKSADLMEEIGGFLDPIERELVLSAGFQKDNLRQMSEIIERRHVLRVCQNVKISAAMNELKDGLPETSSAYMSMSLLDGPEQNNSESSRREEDRLRNFISGVLPIESIEQMKRMLYRISRGNAIARFNDIEEDIIDPASGEPMKKSVFWIVFLGQQLNTRIRKMCDIIHATIYDMPDSQEETSRQITALTTELADKNSVNTRTEESIFNLLSRLAYDGSSSPLLDWEFALHKEKMICNIFMKCHFYLTMIALEGWCPTKEIQDFREVCRNAVLGSGHPPAAVEVNPAAPLRQPETPPTYFITDKFTSTFQGIVDTYGVPRYKEINPGLYTIISFPFLFGVMYGDIGHGIALTLFSIFLVRNEVAFEKMRRAGTLGEIPTMAFGGRYVMLLMGIFAIYCGTIYNDCLSIPIPAYPSNWKDSHVVDPSTQVDTWEATDNPIYPWGVDYNWYHKSNQLAFFNGMKMKMAVILGVVQMSFGVVLSLFNHIYFKDMLAVGYEFIPRFLFLMCTFGYMVVIILYKWSVDWIGNALDNAEGTGVCRIQVGYTAPPGCNPPNLIQTMINMFLSPGSIEPINQLYTGQPVIQGILVLVAVFSIPFMLCGKPCHQDYLRKKNHPNVNTLPASSPSSSDIHQYHDFNSVAASQSSQRNHSDEEKLQIGGSSDSYDLPPSSGADDDRMAVPTKVPNVPAPLHAGLGAAVAEAGHEEAHSLSDELIHNSIHTIEYVLGCVSNTASYLRLWALSLAHAELAEVFWTKMIMQYGIDGSNAPYYSFIGFAVWFAATFAVLLCMDVLECFLHALRLHWVEFQNKFYFADGRPFEPFAFVPSDL